MKRFHTRPYVVTSNPLYHAEKQGACLIKRIHRLDYLLLGVYTAGEDKSDKTQHICKGRYGNDYLGGAILSDVYAHSVGPRH